MIFIVLSSCSITNAHTGIVLVLLVVHFAQVTGKAVVDAHPAQAVGLLIVFLGRADLFEAGEEVVVALVEPVRLGLDAGALTGVVLGAAGQELCVEGAEGAGKEGVDGVGPAAVGRRVIGVRLGHSACGASQVRAGS